MLTKATIKRFRARTVRGNHVVWDYLRNRAITIPLASREEAVRFARGFPATLPRQTK